MVLACDTADKNSRQATILNEVEVKGDVDTVFRGVTTVELSQYLTP